MIVRLTLELELSESARSPRDTTARAQRILQLATAYVGRLRNVEGVSWAELDPLSDTSTTPTLTLNLEHHGPAAN